MIRPFLVILILITVATLAYGSGYRSSNSKKLESPSLASVSPSPSLSPMEAHMKVLDDGHTIMMMGGTYHPGVLHVSPGATIKVLNHELASAALMSDDHTSFASDFIEPGKEDVFTAPTKPGSYPFHVHFQGSDKMIKGGNLVVEN